MIVFKDDLERVDTIKYIQCDMRGKLGRDNLQRDASAWADSAAMATNLIVDRRMQAQRFRE